MKFLSLIMTGLSLVGILVCASTGHAQPAITDLYPNGTNLFQPSSTLSFTASSPAGVTNVTVQLTVTSLYTGQSFIKNLTAASGLAITGPNTTLNVSAALSSNTLYSAAIQVQDANGNTINQTVSFDTITPSYTWEAEDFDYTNGLYVDNPQVNQYANLSGVQGVDYNNGSPANGTAAYRPKGLETENPNSGDLPLRLQYIGTTNFDYDVGWTAGGDWGNYTRHYPAGTYVLFVRVAGGGAPSTESGDISVVNGTATTTGAAPYKYGVNGLGWNHYDYMPVTDSSNNLVQFTFDGSPCTLRETQVNASDNLNFFMLMPVPVVVPSTVMITNVTPDGSALYNQAGTFSFNVYSPSAPVDSNNIVVLVAATNLWGHGYASSLTSASGLAITGESTNYNVSLATTTNTIYTVSIQVTDANGTPSSTSLTFDTIVAPPVVPVPNANYTFEAEDFDWDSGQYVDNPQTNAYFGLDGVAEVDYHVDAQHGGDYNRIGLTTEMLNEKQRPQYNGTGEQDYDVGFNDGGNWGNYTRNYPAGIYNIYVRGANGTGNTSADSGSISLVTGGLGTSIQTLSKLGTFSIPSIAWSTYGWYPVKDSAGNLVQFTGGSLETLRMTIDGGNCNENFFLLTPADPSVVLQPYVDNFQPDGSALFLDANELSFVVHSQPGTATNNITLNLNGVDISGMNFSGTPNIINVSYPVKTNAYYTAIITVTDANGTVHATNSFSTFDSTDYQWEAEDYDHNGGQYFDNPQVGSYAGVAGVSGTDFVESDVEGPGRGNVYRLADGSDFPDAVAGDQARQQFTNAGKTDYNLGSFGTNSWANYTRHYPAGTYYVYGRFAEGAGVAQANLSLLTNGVSTNLLGTFTIPNLGWGTWQWQQMLGDNGQPAKVTFDGSPQILRMGGLSASEVNVNFLMLVPATPSPKLTVSILGGSINILFPTQSGYNYQLEYKDHLVDATWTPVGGSLSGNDAVQSVGDTMTNGSRFYRVEIQ